MGLYPLEQIMRITFSSDFSKYMNVLFKSLNSTPVVVCNYSEVDWYLADTRIQNKKGSECGVRLVCQSSDETQRPQMSKARTCLWLTW